jgi:hypothetical protein
MLPRDSFGTQILTLFDFYVTISTLKEVFLVLSTIELGSLDDFKLFYEELTPFKPTNRIRRLRRNR